jgi:hypothetical protein
MIKDREREREERDGIDKSARTAPPLVTKNII